MKKSTYLIGLALGASTLTFAQVGIGTSTPSSPLDIQADDAAIDLNSEAAGGSRDPKINFQLTGTTTFSIGIDDGDSDKLKIGTTAPDASTRMTIDGSGNVGIGTTGPNSKLSVGGGVQIKSFTAVNEQGMHLHWNRLGFGISYILNEKGVGSGGISFGTVTTGDVITEQMFITNSGDVGIGNTSPTAKLDVDGSAIFNESGAAVDFKVEGDTEANLLFVDGSADRIGIGTSSPSAVLDIEADDAAIDLNSEAAVGSRDPKINFQLTGTTTFSIGIDDGDSDKLKIGTTAPDASTRMTIDGSGNVGIGTTGPNSKLSVGGGVQIKSVTAVNDQGMHLHWNRVGFGRSYILNQKGGGSGGISFGKVTTGNVITEQMLITEAGNVGIGTTSPGYKLTVNGQPGANGYTAFTNYSDRRLKTNIDSLDAGALDKILQLNPVSFQYNDKYLQLYPESDLERVHKGFIAQEIQKVFPEMVSEMKESPDSVKYLDLDISHLQVYLVKALQEQQAIIESQKKENESQKAEIESLKAEASNATSSSEENASEIEALKAQVQQMLQLLQQQESASVVK